MTSTTINRPSFSPRALRVAAVVVVLVIAGGGLLFASPFGDAPTDDGSPIVSGPPEAPFRLSYPDSWQPVAQSELATMPGSPLAVVRRKDGQATIVVDQEGKLDQSPEQLAGGLRKQLAKRFSDFKEVSAKTVTIAGGRAFVYAFARTRAGTAQTMVVVPAGQVSYSLNAVVRPGAPEAAREVGAMIASFDVKGK